jgi:hypothetical protein
MLEISVANEPNAFAVVVAVVEINDPAGAPVAQ